MLSVSENLGGAAEKGSIVGGCFYSAGQGKELKRRSFPCTPSWLEPQDGQPSLLMLVGPIVSIKAGPNQVVKSTRSRSTVIDWQELLLDLHVAGVRRIDSWNPCGAAPWSHCTPVPYTRPRKT